MKSFKIFMIGITLMDIVLFTFSVIFMMDARMNNSKISEIQNTYHLQTVYVNSIPYEIALDFRKETE